MAEIIKIKKGLDIPLIGPATDTTDTDTSTKRFAMVPDDFPGLKWKLSVRPGDKIECGSPLLHEKEKGRIKITSPVAGTVTEVVRGERRKIEAVIVEAAGEQTFLTFDCNSEGTDLIAVLCQSGLWGMLRQRPYDIIPNPDIRPRDIFITAFDTAPLAPEIVATSDMDALENGIKALSTLTVGKVYLGVRFGSGISSATAEVIEFQGAHPAGNPGVQIANVKPVNKGETVWTLDARTAARIGRLVTTGKLDTETLVAVTGPEVKDPHYIKTRIGASMKSLLSAFDLGDDKKLRVISGNVLTGERVSASEGFLRFPWRQITVIAEGDDADEFMGWASINPKRYSVKRSFPAFLRGLGKPFEFDARLKGGHRAMIVSGEYDKVFPMDIYPEFLIKAILAKDIDKMERLGIYEVAPEDFALAEFVDTSKLPLQQIVADGLDYLRSELG